MQAKIYSFKIYVYFTLFCSIFFVNQVLSFPQLASELTQSVDVTISYGETIENIFTNVEDLNGTSFVVDDIQSSQIVSSGVGQEILTYKFSAPGLYSVKITSPLSNHNHAGGCDHPEFPETLLIAVSDKKITYLVDEAVLSGQIVGGVSTNGLSITLPVLIESFTGSKVEVPRTVASSGVNTSIQGSLSLDENSLTPGRYDLTYKLSGVATKDTYISFDFNKGDDNLSTYYLLEKIK